MFGKLKLINLKYVAYLVDRCWTKLRALTIAKSWKLLSEDEVTKTESIDEIILPLSAT